jgi:spermidine/putrescine transport system permease protein
MTRRLPPLLVALVGGIFVLLHLPVLVLVLYSFNTSRYAAGWTGFTLHWYARLLERPDILRALRLSLIVATVSTLVATALGTLVALALARRPFRGQRLVEGGLYLPIVTPEIVAGIALLILFAALRIPLGVGTVLVAHTAFSLPFVAVVVLARLRGMDRSLEEAALVLGADEATAFRRVTLPLLAPGILAGALLAFTLSLDDFVITFFVAGPGSTTLPVLVYSMVRRGIEPTINAVSAVLVLLTTLTIALAARVGGERGV